MIFWQHQQDTGEPVVASTIKCMNQRCSTINKLIHKAEIIGQNLETFELVRNKKSVKKLPYIPAPAWHTAETEELIFQKTHLSQRTHNNTAQQLTSLSQVNTPLHYIYHSENVGLHQTYILFIIHCHFVFYYSHCV